jgi:hypothetical protein
LVILLLLYYILLLLSIGIDTGGVLIEGGKVTLDGVSFSLNTLSKSSDFPNLRHNVFVSKGALLDISLITVDTGASNFVYVDDGDDDDNDSSIVNGLDVYIYIYIYIIFALLFIYLFYLIV